MLRYDGAFRRSGEDLIQRGELALGFLHWDEVGIGVLPDIEQLLIAAGGGGFIKMRLGAGGAQETESIIGRLCCSPFLQGQSAVAETRGRNR